MVRNVEDAPWRDQSRVTIFCAPRPRAKGLPVYPPEMSLTSLDWTIVLLSLAVSFVPALVLMWRAGASTTEFFTSGRSAPWWLIGVSMVATTFSTDTPNLVTNLVREGGVVDAASDDPMVVGTRALFDAVHADPRVDATALQLVGRKEWDGVLMAIVR